MDKNKSIDGLVSRRKQPAASSFSSQSLNRKSNPKKIVVKKTTSTPKPANKPTPKPTKKTTIEVNTIKQTNEESPSVSEEFLKPVQTFDFDSESGELKAPSKTSEDDMKDNKTPEKSKKSKKKTKKPKKPMSKKRKITLIIISVIVFILFAAVIWFIIWGNDIIAKITGGQGNVFDLITFVEEKYEPLKTDENGRTNILAFGTSGYNMDGDEYGETHDGAQLTDSIMVISLNQETGDIAMLSLPRDLKASPTCTATGKINEVYWCNNMEGDDEEAGATALMKEVGDILGIEFQYYVHINWGSLVDIVDILGGITVTLDEGIYDYAFTGAVYDPDVEYTLDGEEALGLARARHGTTSGDFSRGASQQKILIGIKDKLLASKLSIPELLDLASTLGDDLRTNFNLEEMKTLAHFLSVFDFENMRQVSLLDPIPYMTTGNIGGISYVLPSAGTGNYYAIQEYVATMFSNDPRDYEESTILVLNGTESAGLASTEKSTLTSDGYKNIDVDDAPEGNYPEKYALYALANSAPGTKKLLEEKYGSAKTSEELPPEISTDYDFIIILGGEAKNEKNSTKQ